jgi:N-acetyl-gamma-glutamyl-phosphate reductase
VHPKLKGIGDVALENREAVKDRAVDVVFSCLPHGDSMEAVASYLERGVKAIDISADFRIDDPAEYERWYGVKHAARHLLPAVYGLPEINRSAIAKAALVANPGCYPTGALLGLIPLAEERLIDPGRIIVDAKTGISGAGRKAAVEYLFVESSQSVVPYSIGRQHRHVSEMEQELGKLLGASPLVVFTPQRVPINQGILSTIYVQLNTATDTDALVELYRGRYGGEPFVRVVEGYMPEPRYVCNTNFCDVTVQAVSGTDTAIVVTAIDNLIKGAVGQAVQNMNLMFGLDETTGLL